MSEMHKLNDIKASLDINKLPQHIAIIMDGNGRWARQRGMDRVMGHQYAVTAVRETAEAAAELGIRYLTLYTFSKENWKRPQHEVDAIMNLLVETIHSEIDTLTKNNIRLRAIGDIEQLEPLTRQTLEKAIESTACFTRMDLVLAISYSARWEITTMVKKITNEVLNGNLNPDQINEDVISTHLCAPYLPDPELLIRTSGEYRISNFLLWQIAYTELYFTPILWPDFRKQDLYLAIADYQRRERRFGRISEQSSS
jgi:undecaprenyl diphosphate synthase